MICIYFVQKSSNLYVCYNNLRLATIKKSFLTTETFLNSLAEVTSMNKYIFQKNLHVEAHLSLSKNNSFDTF